MEDKSNYLLTWGQDSYLPLLDFAPHQLEVLQTDNHRFKVLVWHRRARKTTTAIAELLKQAHLKVGVYWIVFPTKTEAKDAIWKDPNMLFRVIPQALIDRQNEVELTLYLKCGSVIILKGADEPDSLRGAGPSGVVLDEFAKMKFETWEVLEPILRANGGWVWFIGTPKGKNHLYRFYQRGQIPDVEWKSWLLKASQSGIIEADQLEKSKQTSTQATWNQEWECEFLEGEGAVFKGVELVMKSQPKGPEADHIYVMGVDLAKYQDYTVLSIFDRENNNQVYRDRFRNQEWRYVKTKIKTVAEHYNKALVVIDSTGVGDPIYEDLSRLEIPVESYKFTEQSKKELIEKLAIWIELKQIELLNQPEAKYEYDNYTYTLGPTGKVRYGAPEGYNDDIVTADALGVYPLVPIGKRTMEQSKTLIRYSYEQKLKERYEDAEEIAYTGGDLNEWGAV